MYDLLVICGATAVGKSALALELAKELECEIISVDSVQVYRSLDVGTSKPTAKEQAMVPHHMIDIISPFEEFNVALYTSKARQIISEVQKRGKLPVLVGGTGLYIQSLLSDYSFSSKGRKINNDAGYNFMIICPVLERLKLYRAIDDRVDYMIKNGLIDEVKTLYEMGIKENAQSMKAIGYKELIPYLNNEVALEHAIAQIKQNSRNYAKRQMTWFRGMKDIKFFDAETEKEFVKTEILNKFKKYKKPLL